MSETIPSTTSTAISLSNRTLIAVTGKDVVHFLHNILTANIEALPPGRGTLSALLTPQGKIAFEMLVYNASDEEPLVLIDVLTGFAEPLVEKLALYKLRAEISITLLGDEIGTMVLEALKRIDHVAFVRYASVYKDFADPQDFRDLIGELTAEGKADADGGADGM